MADSEQAAVPVISMRNVVKAFDDKRVIDGLTLDIMPGETLVVMGGSGSGKSTTLRLMIGSLEANEGQIRIAGTDICCASEDELNAVRKKIGVLFQSGALFNSMTLAENVALPLVEHTELDREIIDIQVKIKLELVGLREHADKFPSEISGGMKKRAGPGTGAGAGPADIVLRRAERRARPRDQRRDRPAHHRPVQEARRHEHCHHARDGLGVRDRRPDGHARQGQDAHRGGSRVVRKDPRHRGRRCREA